MNGMKEIFGKELTRVFKDKKMVFSVFFLPVILMVLIMSLMGRFVSDMEKDIDKHVPKITILNEPSDFPDYLSAGKFELEINNELDEKTVKADILSGDMDLLVEFPEDFDSLIQNYKEGDAVPQIKVYYNPSEDYSGAAYQEMTGAVLEGYRQLKLGERVGNLDQITIFTVNSDNKDMIIQNDQKANGKALGMMLPYFITILLFAGAMGIGTDMIAGEKERGTMASLLVSPVKRSHIVLGKVFSLMVISGISSIVYAVAMIVCMPMMSKSMGGASGLKLSLDPKQGIMLAALLVALAFLYSTLIALVSVFAKTTKEASTYIMPAYMVVMVVGMMSMFASGEMDGVKMWIPIYNSSMVLKGILSQEVTMVQYAVTLVETFVCGGILTAVIVKAFESEKVMSV